MTAINSPGHKVCGVRLLCSASTMQREMPEDLKKFEAVFAECTRPECKLETTTFQIEDEEDALEVAEDLCPAGME